METDKMKPFFKLVGQAALLAGFVLFNTALMFDNPKAPQGLSLRSFEPLPTDAELERASKGAGFGDAYRAVPGDRVALNYIGITQAPIMTVTSPDGGTVTSSPAGINCPGTCTYAFTSGNSVSLTATPRPSNASSTVHGTGTEAYGNWGGSACPSTAGTAVCTFTFGVSHNTASITFTPKDSDVWWVSPSGSDTLNDGRSILTPYATVHKANTQMARGDSLYFGSGTYTGTGGCIGCFNGITNPSDVPNGTSRKSTRYLSYIQQAAILEGAYTTSPVALFHRSNVEVGGFTVLHGDISSDGSTGGSGASLIPVYSSGSLQSITIAAGGVSYQTGASNLITLFGISCTTYPEVTFTTSGGAVNGYSIVYAGTGCTPLTGVGASVDIKANNIYFHDNSTLMAWAGTTPGSNGQGIGVSCNRCANSLFERNWIAGYGNRYGLLFYAGVWNVARQNVARFDGFIGGNPIAAIALYTEDYSIAENNIALDFASDPQTDMSQAIFNTSSATLSAYPYGTGTVAFYGNVIINVYGTQGSWGLRLDNNASTSSTPAGGVQATMIVQDNVAFSSAVAVSGTAFAGNAGDNLAGTNGAHHDVIYNHNTFYNKAGGNSAVVLDNHNATLNSIAINNNAILSPDFNTTSCNRGGATSSTNNIWWQCNNAFYDPLPSGSQVNPSFTWPLRAGSGAPTVGATVDYQYRNGTLTGTLLWPFPNETAIKTTLCYGPDDYTAATIAPASFGAGQNGKRFIITSAGNTTWSAVGAGANTVGTIFTANGGTGSGTGIAQPYTYTRAHNVGPPGSLCTLSKTLTQYVWEQLGSPSPY